MKKMAIYPYNRKFASVIEFLPILNKDIEIVAVCSPKGFAMDGMDAGAVYRRSKMGLTISSDLDSAIRGCEILLIPDFEMKEAQRKRVLDKVLQCVDYVDELWCALQLNDEETALLSMCCIQHGKVFTPFCGVEESINTRGKELRLQVLPVPVIFVAPMVDKIDTLEALLMLTSRFRELGYGVCSITTKAYGEMLNITPMPSFFLSNHSTKPLNEKIILLNQFAIDQMRLQKADVIIMELPGGLLPYDRKIKESYGILSYMISISIIPDYVLLCVPSDIKDAQAMGRIKTFIQNRYGFSIDSINITNTYINWIDSNEKNDITLDFADVENIPKRLNQIHERIDDFAFNVLDGSNRQALFEHVLQTLNTYSDIHQIL